MNFSYCTSPPKCLSITEQDSEMTKTQVLTFMVIYLLLSKKGHWDHDMNMQKCIFLFKLVLLFFTFPLRPLPPSWSSHCQSTPRTTLAPAKIPLAVIFFDLRRDSSNTLKLLKKQTTTQKCQDNKESPRILQGRKEGNHLEIRVTA